MKLLVCTYEYFPHGSGIANVVYNVVRELKKKGVDCTVCSPTGPDIKLGNRWLIAKTGILGFMDFWLQVRKLDMSKYDAVWLNQPICPRKISHKNLIVTVHTTYYHYANANFSPKIYYKLAGRIEKYCMKKFGLETSFVSITESVESELLEIGIEKEKIRIIPNGVDTLKFKPVRDKMLLRKKLGLPLDKKIILSVGRLTEQKQPYKMLELFSELEKSDDSFFLAVAGKGELLEKAKDLAKDLAIKNSSFLGFVPEKDLPSLYACSDFYIMLSKYEGQPLTLLEAMASGLPCIVSDIPSLDVVKTANCGILINASKPKFGAAKIKLLNSKKLAEFSKNARKYAEEIDWKKIAYLYNKILSGK